MTFRICLYLALLAAASPAAGSQSDPEAAQMLRSMAIPPEVSMAGKMSILPDGAKRPRKVEVWSLPGGRSRRDLLSAGRSATRSVISDRNSIWYYDRIGKVAWKGKSDDVMDTSWLLTAKELDLLIKNYSIRLFAKTNRVAGRACRTINVTDALGHLMRRLWLDREYGVPLEIRSYRLDGSVSSFMRFLQVDFEPRIDEKLFQFSPPAGTTIIPSRRKPNYLDWLGPLPGGRNPALPRWVPAGFHLESSDVVVYQGVRVIHSRYSDGLQALSLFQCPDKFRISPGDPADSKTRVLEWRHRHHRFALVGSLSVEMMNKMAESLP